MILYEFEDWLVSFHLKGGCDFERGLLNADICLLGTASLLTSDGYASIKPCVFFRAVRERLLCLAKAV